MPANPGRLVVKSILSAAALVAFAVSAQGQGAPLLERFAGDVVNVRSADATLVRPSGIAFDGAGNLFVAEPRNSTIRKVTPNGAATLVAGSPGVSGNADGPASAATFSAPANVAVDSAGNLYVADSGNHTIRKVTVGGMVTTLAGKAGESGTEDGAGPQARFKSPEGIAIDGAGNLIVADTANHTIRKINPTGVVNTLAGTAEHFGSDNGTGTGAMFNSPKGIAFDGAGNLYVADSGSYLIRKMTPAAVVTTLAGKADASGSTDGVGAAARFHIPQSVAVDKAGNVYVADKENSTIRKITPAGVVTTLVGVAKQNGFTAGPLPGLLSAPQGVAISSTSLYITQNNGIAVMRNLP